MTRILTRFLGRLPIGWLQLIHNKGRMAGALAGVAFANILVFVQLGIMGALNGTVAMSYKPIVADIIISASDANTLSDGSNLSRRYLYQALSVPGVSMATPLYIGKTDWNRPDGDSSSIIIYGFDPDATQFISSELRDDAQLLKLQNTALIDSKTRGLDSSILNGISLKNPLRFEFHGLTISGVDQFAVGSGFVSDGNMIVSDQTFLRIFPKRLAGTPSHLLIKAEPGVDIDALANKISAHLDSSAIQVRTLPVAIQDDLTYQTTQKPTGVIFGFGVFIGVLVGVVIVYQVLSTDVADHIREYATFKAIGYTDKFFLSVILEEALVLAVLGFIPGVIIASFMYVGIASATQLPVNMESSRMISILLGTIAACAFSGFIATRRLAAADPADLF